ncbi:H-X9-DG-CTERM domain-containing protein [Fimbriiglobus ruber]|uniref:H-X9-DG-CTERM domain-containing protein n=1 Tax=Fimbriiglobus ruber TaxID=1908690 RepID=UPI003083F0D2
MKCQYAWGFGSYHTGVTNYVFCDGSVKGLADSIDAPTYAALLTPANGDIPPNSY